MSSFFTFPASQRKRKRADDQPGKPAKRRGVQTDGSDRPAVNGKSSRPRKIERDESISGSESEEEEIQPESAEESDGTSEEGETAADRRIRLAQRYLDNIREEVDETGFDAAEIDKDLIAQRLKEDVDEAKGRQYRLIATTLDCHAATQATFRMNTLSTTGVAVCSPYAYTVSKDRTLIKWELITPQLDPPVLNGTHKQPRPLRSRPTQLALIKGIKIDANASKRHGHIGEILSLAASPDGRYVATAGQDKRLIIWSAEDLTPLKTFSSHRDAVTGLSFAPSTSQAGVGSQLFSASMDRCLKTYSLNGDDSLAYVETLFGHQDHVVAVAAMGVDQCVSVGARDRTARMWKVVDETQLVFRADSSKHDAYTTGSVDCVAALPPANFVTGSDSGAVGLWSIHKKKALFTIQLAHGAEEPEPLEQVSSETDPEVLARLKKDDKRRPIPRGITALATVSGTDIVLSGSWDGWVRVWKVSDDKRSLSPQGVLGKFDNTNESSPETNGHPNGTSEERASVMQDVGPIKGVINSMAVFERRKEMQNEFGAKKDGESLGLCVIIGTGKEMRLGRWKKVMNGKNGATVLEVPIRSKET
jgi:ribosomal RNA-processing protein 9